MCHKFSPEAWKKIHILLLTHCKISMILLHIIITRVRSSSDIGSRPQFLFQITVSNDNNERKIEEIGQCVKAFRLLRVRNKWEIEWQQSCQTFNLSASFPAVMMMWCAIISKYNFRLYISIPQNYLLFLIHTKAKKKREKCNKYFLKFVLHSSSSFRLRLLSLKKHIYKILILTFRATLPV